VYQVLDSPKGPEPARPGDAGYPALCQAGGQPSV